jgi:hypothetical protein
MQAYGTLIVYSSIQNYLPRYSPLRCSSALPSSLIKLLRRSYAQHQTPTGFEILSSNTNNSTTSQAERIRHIANALRVNSLAQRNAKKGRVLHLPPTRSFLILQALAGILTLLGILLLGLSAFTDMYAFHALGRGLSLRVVVVFLRCRRHFLH